MKKGELEVDLDVDLEIEEQGFVENSSSSFDSTTTSSEPIEELIPDDIDDSIEVLDNDASEEVIDGVDDLNDEELDFNNNDDTENYENEISSQENGNTDDSSGETSNGDSQSQESGDTNIPQNESSNNENSNQENNNNLTPGGNASQPPEASQNPSGNQMPQQDDNKKPPKERGENLQNLKNNAMNKLNNNSNNDLSKKLNSNNHPRNLSKENARARENRQKENEEKNDDKKQQFDEAKKKVAKEIVKGYAQAHGMDGQTAELVADAALKAQEIQDKLKKYVIIGCVLIFFFFIISITATVSGGEDGENVDTETKNSYLYGGGTEEELYSYLAGKGYCDDESTCSTSPAATFYKELKSVLNSNSNLTKQQADIFITEFIFYGRDETTMFAATEEIQYIADIITSSGKFDINDIDKYKESFTSDSGYFVTYRSDLLEEDNSVEYKEKLYNRISSSAATLSKMQDKLEEESYVCGYDVNGVNVSDVKVRLLQCADDTRGEPIEGEELIDFEKYVLGVVYAENGGGPTEALKAQAIATRTYSLLRGDEMGHQYNLGLTNENGQWVLSIRNCTEDQVYCDPDKGCWSNDATAGGTVHSGYDSSKAYSKQPLAADSSIRTAVADTEYKVLVGADGKMVSTHYTNTEQTQWNTAANAGKDHFELLKLTYTNATNIHKACTSTSITGIFSTWKQSGESWSGISLGSSSETISSAGCLATSVAIQIAKSGTTVNSSTFDPGVFVRHLNKHGGFTSEGNFFWYSPSFTGIAPNFIYSGEVALTGTNSEKASTIKSYQDQGYYIVIRAKTNQHWVSLDKVVGDEVYMFDPATNATKLFEKYVDNDRMVLYVNNG